MALPIAINLVHVHAIFQHFNEILPYTPIQYMYLNTGRSIFESTCCALVETFGPSFSMLLDIIAEEEQYILAPSKLWKKKQIILFGEVDAETYMEKFSTELRERTMPHHRAHYIMKHIFRFCKSPYSTMTDPMTRRFVIPTQEKIDEMVGDHEAFLRWVRTETELQMQEEDEDEATLWFSVKNELFPQICGSIVESIGETDTYFAASGIGPYYVILRHVHSFPTRISVVEYNNLVFDLKIQLISEFMPRRIPLHDTSHSMHFGENDYFCWKRIFSKTGKYHAYHRNQSKNEIIRSVHPWLRGTCQAFL